MKRKIALSSVKNGPDSALVTMRRRLLILCPITLCYSLGVAVADPKLTELRPFDENLDATAKVSTPLDPIKGIVDARLFLQGFAGVADGFSIYLPEDRELCLHYQTRNDLYNATHDFAIADAPGWEDVAFPVSENSEYLARYGAETFLPSALLRDRCDTLPDVGAPERPLVRALGSEMADYIAVVHLDTQSADVLVYQRGTREPVASAPCTPFAAGDGVAFNATCPIPDETFQPDHRAFLVIATDDGASVRKRLHIRFPGEAASK